MQLASQSLNRWLSLRLEAVGAVVSFAAAALAIEQQGHAAWAGLTLSYALQMTALTTMTVRAALCCDIFRAAARDLLRCGPLCGAQANCGSLCSAVPLRCVAPLRCSLHRAVACTVLCCPTALWPAPCCGFGVGNMAKRSM